MVPRPHQEPVLVDFQKHQTSQSASAAERSVIGDPEWLATSANTGPSTGDLGEVSTY